VEGRFTVLRVLIFETGFTFVTFTLGASRTSWISLITLSVFATVLAVRVVEVLRVRLLRGVVVDAVLEDLTGIGIDSDVYSSNIAIKNPLWGFSGHFVNWFSVRLIHYAHAMP